jgi:ABC-type transporter Mla subunit MlaD
VTHNARGELNTVRYEAVNAMLLNEFLKEHRKVESQEATITQLKAAAERQAATTAQQREQIEALTAGLQKVTAQIEAGRPASQIVLSNHL